MKSQRIKFSPEPNLTDLTEFQRDHVMRVFPETRAEMADHLRLGAEVFITRQDEVQDVPPVAIAVSQAPDFWIDCVESESAAHTLAAQLGLVVVDPRAPVQVKPGLTYRFTKSGNLVRAKEPSTYGDPGWWVVARVDSGKEMIVSGGALINRNHPDWS